MRISEPIEKTGYFWLPESEEHKVPGILRISDGGEINLKLFEGIDSNTKDHIDRINTLENFSIYGFLENKTPITLQNCFYNGSLTYEQKNLSTVFANMLIVGSSIDTTNNLFTKCKLSVEGLDEWIFICGIKSELIKDNFPYSHSLRFDIPENIEHYLDDHTKITISFEGTSPRLPIFREAKVTQKVYLVFQFEEGKNIEDILVFIHKIVCFLNFCIDSTVCIDKLSFYNQIQNRWSDIFYQSMPFVNVPNAINMNNMLVPYLYIKENFDAVLSKWFEAYDTIEPSMNLYFFAKNGEQPFIDEKLLSIIQAIETYDRRLNNTTNIEATEYTNLIEILFKNCPEEHRQWIEQKLKYANEISLSKRLKNTSEPFEDVLLTKKQFKRIIRKAVDFRNYMTHFDISLEENRPQGLEILNLYAEFVGIFQCTLLRFLGFSIEDIKKIIEKNPRLRSINHSSS